MNRPLLGCYGQEEVFLYKLGAVGPHRAAVYSTIRVLPCYTHCSSKYKALRGVCDVLVVRKSIVLPLYS